MHRVACLLATAAGAVMLAAGLLAASTAWVVMAARGIPVRL